MIWQRPSSFHAHDRIIAAMPIAVEPELSTIPRILAFMVVGTTVFAALFGALLS